MTVPTEELVDLKPNLQKNNMGIIMKHWVFMGWIYFLKKKRMRRCFSWHKRSNPWALWQVSAEASGWRLRCWKGLQTEGAAGSRRLISWLSQRKWNKRSNSQSPLIIDKGIGVTRAGENETPRINKTGLCSQEQGGTMLWSCFVRL